MKTIYMKKRFAPILPVSQRDLATYLSVSGTLMSMSNTGRHGSRKLGNEASLKLAELVKAHIVSQKATTENPSLKKLEDRAAEECKPLGKKWSSQAAFSRAYAQVLGEQLEEMRIKCQQDLLWLKTVDQLLEKMPNSGRDARDRPWFNHQQLITMERLQKTGPIAQAKLELKMELEKMKAVIYKKMEKRWMKK
jgi:hypothetical protein